MKIVEDRVETLPTVVTTAESKLEKAKKKTLDAATAVNEGHDALDAAEVKEASAEYDLSQFSTKLAEERATLHEKQKKRIGLQAEAPMKQIMAGLATLATSNPFALQFAQFMMRSMGSLSPTQMSMLGPSLGDATVQHKVLAPATVLLQNPVAVPSMTSAAPAIHPAPQEGDALNAASARLGSKNAALQQQLAQMRAQPQAQQVQLQREQIDQLVRMQQGNSTKKNSVDVGPWIVDKLLSRWANPLEIDISGLELKQVAREALRQSRWDGQRTSELSSFTQMEPHPMDQPLWLI